jgi:hypothetical protein
MNMLTLDNKYPNKIYFDENYIVYEYENFKFLLKKVNITDEIGLWFHLQKVVKDDFQRFKRK